MLPIISLRGVSHPSDEDWGLIQLLLMQDEVEEALRIARQWQRRREPIGYMMEAYIHSSMEEYENALDVLTKGVQKYPHAWFLWREIAEVLLQIQHRSEEAVRALDRALKCPNAPVDVILFAKAEVYFLCGEYEKALEVAEEAIPIVAQVVNPIQPVEWFGVLRASAYTQLGDYANAREQLTRLEQQLTQLTHEDKPRLIASSLTEWARLIWRETGDRIRAEEYAYRAFHTYPFLIPTLQLLYDMRKDDPCKPKNVYLVSVSSVLRQPDSEMRAFRNIDYLVIAENGKHAKSLVEPFEADAESVYIRQPRIEYTIRDYREIYPERQSHCGVVAVRPGGLMDMSGWFAEE